MYKKFFKGFLDFTLSLVGIILLSPILIILILLGFIFMRGNPFFVQKRVGKNEKIFSLIKFRTMDNRKDKEGNLLPDEVRLNKYGRILRKTSLDELPELFNILKGDMSIIGPRPLLVQYLPYYTEKERHRHDCRPGLSGLAQINGRNFISWEEIFEYDLAYLANISIKNDFKIIFKTIRKVISGDDIADLSKIKIGKDGEEYCVINGEKYFLRKELCIERKIIKNK